MAAVVHGRYAAPLGDCGGILTDEHWIPRAIQRIFAPVNTDAPLYKNRVPQRPQPAGSYAHGRVLCRHHHDLLDGLDKVARDYIRNLMIIVGQGTKIIGLGRLQDVVSPIDGRRFERWLLKAICGGISVGHIRQPGQAPPAIPLPWLQALFERSPWPEPWAISLDRVDGGIFGLADEQLAFRFFWHASGELLGCQFESHRVTLGFNLSDPVYLLRRPRRPRGIAFMVHRPDGGDVIEGVPEGAEVSFRFAWPEPPASEFTPIATSYTVPGPSMLGLSRRR